MRRLLAAVHRAPEKFGEWLGYHIARAMIWLVGDTKRRWVFVVVVASALAFFQPSFWQYLFTMVVVLSVYGVGYMAGHDDGSDQVLDHITELEQRKEIEIHKARSTQRMERAKWN